MYKEFDIDYATCLKISAKNGYKKRFAEICENGELNCKECPFERYDSMLKVGTILNHDNSGYVDHLNIFNE